MVTYFTLLAALGSTIYGQRKIAYYRDNKEEMSQVFWNTFFFRCVMSLISFILYFIYAIFFEGLNLIIQIIYCISKKQLNAKQIFVPCWKYLLSGSIMLLFVETLKTKFSGGIVSLCVLICTGGLSYVGVLLILRDRFFIDNINKILKRK